MRSYGWPARPGRWLRQGPAGPLGNRAGTAHPPEDRHGISPDEACRARGLPTRLATTRKLGGKAGGMGSGRGSGAGGIVVRARGGARFVVRQLRRGLGPSEGGAAQDLGVAGEAQRADLLERRQLLLGKRNANRFHGHRFAPSGIADKNFVAVGYELFHGVGNVS
jgi:hypothetical protein